MNDREKLVELLGEAYGICLRTKCQDCKWTQPEDSRISRTCQNRLIANHLIANGVTVGDAKSATTTEHDKAFASGFQEGMDHARSRMGGPHCDACPTRETYAKAARERDGYKKELEERKQEVQK